MLCAGSWGGRGKESGDGQGRGRRETLVWLWLSRCESEDVSPLFGKWDKRGTS